MGQPKFPRKNYETPNHPWQGERIQAEHELKRKYGLKNKREIWKAQTRLREIRGQARELVSRTRNPADTQAAGQAKLLLKRLHRSGYIAEDAALGDVLGMNVETVLNRRLQSQVYFKGLARTPKQARQFVSHGLIRIGDRRVTVPSYLVRREEESLVHIDPSKAVADAEHPVRPKPMGYDAIQEAKEGAEEAVAEAPSRAPVAAPAPAAPAPAPEAPPAEDKKEASQ